MTEFGKLLRDIFGPRDVSEEYRQLVRRVADRRREQDDSNRVSASSDSSAIVVVSELFRIAGKKVLIFGKTLPAGVFLSEEVTFALREYLYRNPEAQLQIITSDERFTADAIGLACGIPLTRQMLARTVFLPCPPDSHRLFQFMYVDSDIAPSAFVHDYNGRVPNFVSNGYGFFRNSYQSEVMRRMFERMASQFGSPT